MARCTARGGRGGVAAMKRQSANTPISPRPSPPPRAEGESKRRRQRSPSALSGRRPGRRDRAARVAQSQANGVSARRVREMNKLGRGTGGGGLFVCSTFQRGRFWFRARGPICRAHEYSGVRDRLSRRIPLIPLNPGESRIKLVSPQVGRRSGSRRWPEARTKSARARDRGSRPASGAPPGRSARSRRAAGRRTEPPAAKSISGPSGC